MTNAALHPSHCRQAPGLFIPRINRNRCEGKGPCVEACPLDVLAMGLLGPAERSGLSWVGRIKALAHGHRQAFVVRPEACAACGDCIRACPKHAITLTRSSTAAPSESAQDWSDPQ
ncbi:ferredoxin family protein [Rubrivivax albus]|uniref:Ferredoxin family protein n=2 Tax=Rubrivivax albus TaxID=2499835 RepID=A0A437JYU3_9BURK|nr:ferredoxin family protein [Rubrivivax albus]